MNTHAKRWKEFAKTHGGRFPTKIEKFFSRKYNKFPTGTEIKRMKKAYKKYGEKPWTTTGYYERKPKM